MEVNEHSLTSNVANEVEKIRYWLSVAKENGNKIYLGTDAHYYTQVGDFEHTIRMLNEVGYPKELILNCNENMIDDLYSIKTNEYN